MPNETTPDVFARELGRGPGTSPSSRRVFADIRALELALVQEDLPAARAAFHRLLEDSPLMNEAVSRDPFPSRNRPLKALRALARCLTSGDLPRARQAFEQFC